MNHKIFGRTPEPYTSMNTAHISGMCSEMNVKSYVAGLYWQCELVYDAMRSVLLFEYVCKGPFTLRESARVRNTYSTRNTPQHPAAALRQSLACWSVAESCGVLYTHDRPYLCERALSCVVDFFRDNNNTSDHIFIVFVLRFQ